MQPCLSLDNDLATLSPEHLRIVRRWAEHRLFNAINPLALSLQLLQDETHHPARVIKYAQHTITTVLQAVQEIWDAEHTQQTAVQAVLSIAPVQGDPRV